MCDMSTNNDVSLSATLYKSIVEHMMNAFAMHKIITDTESNPIDYIFVDVNSSFERLVGMSKSEIIGKSIHDLKYRSTEDAIDWLSIYQKAIQQGEHSSTERYSSALGIWFIIHAYMPQDGYIITVFNDISDIKNSEISLKHMTTHDSVTGLPNLSSLVIDLNAFIEKSPLRRLALLHINADNFRYIKSTLGYEFGEKMVAEIGNRLSSIFHDKRLYALGRDEFMIAFPDFSSDEEIHECAERILQEFTFPFHIKDRTLHTTAGVGISIYPQHGKSADELVRNADIALIKAKEKGKNKYAFYSDDMHSETSNRLVLEKHLHSALENNEFELYYQPQLDLSSNEICGFEALIRWHNPELGMVPPSVFIELAEYNHLIIPIGKWVLRNACYFIKKLQNLGYIDFTVAVNVSVLQLMQEDFVDTVLTQLQLLDLKPSLLEVEITESILVESYDIISQKLQILRDHGIRISLDDFGKGYSSMSELQTLPIDKLKIDKVFIDMITNERKDFCITDMIIMLGKKMGLTVLAEGVETQEQKAYLLEHNCDVLQGYLFSKPVPESKIFEMLKKVTHDHIETIGFDWKDEYCTGIKAIDKQHMKLFDIGKHLVRAAFIKDQINPGAEVRAMMQELIKYTDYHFKYEEGWLKEHGYVHLETHMAEHRNFIDRVRKLSEEMNESCEQDRIIEMVDVVAVWITKHILIKDMDFVESSMIRRDG